MGDIWKSLKQHSDISERQNSPPWIRRGGVGTSQRGVVGARGGRTTPATACGHGIPSSAEEGELSVVLRESVTYVAM